MVCLEPHEVQLSTTQRCSECHSDQLQWGVSRGRVVADVLLCALCNHRERIEDWTVPLSPLRDSSCANCGQPGRRDPCEACGLSIAEDREVHLELRALVAEEDDFLSASRKANKLGRRVLALKLATAACLYGEGIRKEAARALRVWLLAAIGEQTAAYEDAKAWIDQSTSPSQLAWGSLGQQCEQLELYGDATDAYGKALHVDPTQHLIRCRRAKLLLRQNRDGQALAEVYKLFELTSEKEVPTNALHVAAHLLDRLEKHNNLDDSARLLTLMGGNVSQSPALLGHAARINALAGKSKEARKQLSKARKLDPNLAIYSRVETVLNRSGDGGWRKW